MIANYFSYSKYDAGQPAGNPSSILSFVVCGTSIEKTVSFADGIAESALKTGKIERAAPLPVDASIIEASRNRIDWSDIQRRVNNPDPKGDPDKVLIVNSSSIRVTASPAIQETLKDSLYEQETQLGIFETSATLGIYLASLFDEQQNSRMPPVYFIEGHSLLEALKVYIEMVYNKRCARAEEEVYYIELCPRLYLAD